MTALPAPKTRVKKRLAAIWLAFSSSSFGTIVEIINIIGLGPAVFFFFLFLRQKHKERPRLIPHTSSKIRFIGKHVQHRDDAQCDEAVAPDLLDWVLDLVDDVEGVLEAGVREDDLVHGVRRAVGGRYRAREGVGEVERRVRHARGVPAQHDEARDADEDEGQDLDQPDAVGEPVGEPGVEADD